MAVTIDYVLDNYFTWGSYPYDTWGGSDVVTWGSSYNGRVVMTDYETIHFGLGNEGGLTFAESTLSFAENPDTFEAHVASFYVNKPFKSYITARDSFDRTIAFNKDVEERIRAAETYWDNILFHIDVIENVLLEEYSHRNPKPVFKYDVSLEDTTNRSVSTLLNENVNVLEEYNDVVDFIRFVLEKVIVEDKHNSEYEMFNEEQPFYITDSSNREYTVNSTHTFSLRDVFERTAIFRHFVSDVIKVAEKLSNRPLVKHGEGFWIEELYMGPVKSGILSNIFIREGEISWENFKNATETPPSYTNFMDFKVGEYEYKDALIRITLNSVSQAQPTAQGVTMHVDIPDTDDRGTMAISNTSAPTRVDFHKPYYIVPEVQVSLRSASTSQGVITPNIVQITKSYFTVELLTAGGARTTGVISWASKGY